MKSLKESILDGSNKIVGNTNKKINTIDKLQDSLLKWFVDHLKEIKFQNINYFEHSGRRIWAFNTNDIEGDADGRKLYNEIINEIDSLLKPSIKLLDWYTTQESTQYYVLDGKTRYGSDDDLVIRVVLESRRNHVLIGITINDEYLPKLIDELKQSDLGKHIKKYYKI